MSKNNVTIIVPVYGDWPSLKECIESLIQNTNSAIHKVMLVNDCGPEADTIEKNIKRAIKGHDNFEYHRNKKNLGFVGNCNNAVMKLDTTDNDIVLLNSDTKTTKGFLDEMTAVLCSDDRIATVSPRSNNATICTFPLRAIKEGGIEADQSRALFNKYSAKLPRLNEMPTGHGFCILIRRSVIKKYGLFDTTFGKGYGEEVDFCRRVKKQDWKCVLANRAYVFHLEARSFSMETKKKLIENSRKIIEQRYPEYKAEVTQYIDMALAQEARVMGQSPLKTYARKVARKTKHVVRRFVKR